MRRIRMIHRSRNPVEEWQDRRMSGVAGVPYDRCQLRYNLDQCRRRILKTQDLQTLVILAVLHALLAASERC